MAVLANKSWCSCKATCKPQDSKIKRRAEHINLRSVNFLKLKKIQCWLCNEMYTQSCSISKPTSNNQFIVKEREKKGKGKNNFPHQTSPEGTLTSKNIVWKLPDPYSCNKLVVVVESHFHFIKGLKIIVCW